MAWLALSLMEVTQLAEFNKRNFGQIIAIPLYISEISNAMSGLYTDGEIMGLDIEGSVVAWSEEQREPYIIDVEIEALEPSQLGVLERDRIERDMSFLGLGNNLNEVVSARLPSGFSPA